MNKELSKAKPRRGGRPSIAEAGKIEDRILDFATALFFTEGYGAVSIEEIARRAHISKRTFYARFENKAAIFSAVVQRIIKGLRPSDTQTDQLFKGTDIEVVLRRIAPIIIKASLSSENLALQRLMLAESNRFPELALIMSQQGARQEAIRRIAELLQQSTNERRTNIDPFFAAEQFMFMLTAAPQRRALGLGTVMTPQELNAWASHSVSLFLHGFHHANTSQFS